MCADPLAGFALGVWTKKGTLQKVTHWQGIPHPTKFNQNWHLSRGHWHTVINHTKLVIIIRRSTKLRLVEFCLAPQEWFVTYNTAARLCYVIRIFFVLTSNCELTQWNYQWPKCSRLFSAKLTGIQSHFGQSKFGCYNSERGNRIKKPRFTQTFGSSDSSSIFTSGGCFLDT